MDITTIVGGRRLRPPVQCRAPLEFVTFNAPNFPRTTVHTTAVYVADKWSVGRRLTLNLGVRWSRDDGYIPAQCRDGADTFFPPNCNDHIQGATQQSLSPRLYFTYDVTGNGKTALKGGWGRFSDWRNGNHVLPLNPNVALQRTISLERSQRQWRLRPGRGQPRHHEQSGFHRRGRERQCGHRQCREQSRPTADEGRPVLALARTGVDGELCGPGDGIVLATVRCHPESESAAGTRNLYHREHEAGPGTRRAGRNGR